MNNVDVASLGHKLFPMQIDEMISVVLVDRQYASDFIELLQGEREMLSQWLIWPKFTLEVSDNLQFVNESLEQIQAGTSINCYILNNGRVCGGSGLVSINQTLKKAEIGYWLCASMQGKGIISRVCNALVALAFEHLKLQVIEIRVAEFNLPSRKVCERLGFKLDGTIKHAELLNGQIINHAVYSLTQGNTSSLTAVIGPTK
jgi:ribosomal-protein-serine acetyltransferase